MGEKIRDIKSIQIGQSSFMVELNEGYSKSQGHLIHVQNNKFRYLMTEKEFYHLGAMIMRAWSEFDYLKHKAPDIKEFDVISAKESIYDNASILIKVASLLNANSIDYRFIDNQKERITVVVSDKDVFHAERILLSAGAKKKSHPMGEECGYKFLYQMTPFKMYGIDGVDLEVFCQLPCRSITANTWIPLDKLIQSRLWTMKSQIKDVLWCDEMSRYIYLLCWAVFVDRGFSSHVRLILSSSSHLLNDGVGELFSTVFFNYAPVIIEKLKQGDYESIIPDYYEFTNY